MKEAEKVFIGYLVEHNLRWTSQRKEILDLFLKMEKHLTTDELYRVVRRRNGRIGYATVYRTLKLICESGLAREVDFGDGGVRFEHKYAHKHHDHLVCTRCGKFIEISSPGIERLQNKLAEKHCFEPAWHKMQIFGTCKECRK